MLNCNRGDSGVKIGERIKEIREKRGLTRRELSERLEVTEGTVRRWEHGGMPGKESFRRLYKALEIQMGEFWWGGEVE